MHITILRGISGAGKSTWVKRYLGSPGRPFTLVFSADDFFLDVDGVYVFNATHLVEAHNKCLRDYSEAVKKYWPTNCHFIVDNINAEIWELAPYVALAQAYHREVKILTLRADTALCASRNVRKLSLAALQQQQKTLLDAASFFPEHWYHEVVDSDE